MAEGQLKSSHDNLLRKNPPEGPNKGATHSQSAPGGSPVSVPGGSGLELLELVAQNCLSLREGSRLSCPQSLPSLVKGPWRRS